MFIVIVTLRVKPHTVETFVEGIEANARASRAEPGCLRFDVLRTDTDPHRFMLYEIYRDEAAFYDEHRSTAHYAAWRAVTAECVDTHRNVFCRPLSLTRTEEQSS
ncbi:putative quinol monooxygenase [Streptosporangium sp. NPDC006013]|uniref:putative quinol monooxygenase n=1 Tax=Streptosporangium sp. NPDC006013 TaxID=3155596 RepID=UPI0033B5E712